MTWGCAMSLGTWCKTVPCPPRFGIYSRGSQSRRNAHPFERWSEHLEALPSAGSRGMIPRGEGRLCVETSIRRSMPLDRDQSHRGRGNAE